MHREKWWSQNPPSHLKHLIQARNKNYISSLFTALTTLLGFFPSVITWCQLLPDLPHVLSTPWGSMDSFLSLSFSALKTWEWHILTLCPESYQMLFSQRSGRLRQEMWFKDKSKNPGNISSYAGLVIPWKSTSFLGDAWLVPAPHSFSWAGCTKPPPVMTEVQKQK